jgi:hypothetical protein
MKLTTGGHGRPQTFFQEGKIFQWVQKHTICLKSTQKYTFFLKKSQKAYYFTRPRGGGGQEPPLALPADARAGGKF